MEFVRENSEAIEEMEVEGMSGKAETAEKQHHTLHLLKNMFEFSLVGFNRNSSLLESYTYIYIYIYFFPGP